MDAMAQLGILAAATALAAVTALATAWAFLAGAFRLMQPAGTSRGEVRTVIVAGRPAKSRLELVRGTRAAARAFGRS